MSKRISITSALLIVVLLWSGHPIVNIDCIRELEPMFRGEYLVVVKDGTKLKLSHNYRDNLQQQLAGVL